MKKEQGKKEQKLVKNAKKIRSMVMMLLLCVLLLSAATYAWFTLSNTAKVSNLTMTVGDVTGLQIAEDNGSAPTDVDWKSSIEGGTFKGKLLPATTTDGVAFSEPVYNDDGAVSDVKPTTTKLTAASNNTNEGYWLETSFYLKAMGADKGTTKVKLANGEGISNGIWTDNGSYNGTYVLAKGTDSGDIPASAAVRISLSAGNTTTVFEPNRDYSSDATQQATDSRANKNIISSTVTETMSGTCSDAAIITLTNNTATKITMRIWIEGGDPQCGNEIAAKDIVTQLKFVTDEDTNAGN